VRGVWSRQPARGPRRQKEDGFMQVVLAECMMYPHIAPTETTPVVALGSCKPTSAPWPLKRELRMLD
jgi:hypothetical protein